MVGISIAAFALLLMLDKPYASSSIYSHREKWGPIFVFKERVVEVFNSKMFYFIPHILLSASITVVYEGCAYMAF